MARQQAFQKHLRVERKLGSNTIRQTLTIGKAAINWAWDELPFLGVGAVVPLWVSLAFADWLVKLSLALVALVPFRLLVTKLSPDTA